MATALMCGPWQSDILLASRNDVCLGIYSILHDTERHNELVEHDRGRIELGCVSSWGGSEQAVKLAGQFDNVYVKGMSVGPYMEAWNLYNMAVSAQRRGWQDREFLGNKTG